MVTEAMAESGGGLKHCCDGCNLKLIEGEKIMALYSGPKEVGEHEFVVEPSIGLIVSLGVFCSATREKKMNSDSCSRMEIGKREHQEDKGACVL